MSHFALPNSLGDQYNLVKLFLFQNAGNIGIALGAYLVFLILRNLIGYVLVRRQVSNLPGIHSCIDFFESTFREKLPHIPVLLPARKYTLNDPWKKYADSHSDLIAMTSLTESHPKYVTSSPSVAAYVSARPGTFPKPTSQFRYQAVNLFGKQIISSVGAEWKRHRAVVKGCFGEGAMTKAWEEMANAYEKMIVEEKLEHGGVIQNFHESMIKTTLIVIGQAGFGLDMPWNVTKTEGTELPFAEALHSIDSALLSHILVPRWTTYLPIFGLRRFRYAYDSMFGHLTRMIKNKRAELAVLKEGGQWGDIPKDLLSTLVASQMDTEAAEMLKTSDGQEKVVGLTDSEVMGNTFIFILGDAILCRAGHETTGNTLAFTMAFLAVYPEQQEALYNQISEVCPDGMPTYKDMNRLPLVLAACYETLRLRDVVMFLTKYVAEDATLPYTTWDEAGNITNHTQLVQKGSHIILDSSATQRNPFVWTDPMEYNPARQLEPEAKNNFVGFSLGPRQCIGKRFAEVEMVAFLSHVLKDYKVYPVAEEGESLEDMRERMLSAYEKLTLTPAKFALRFEKR